PLIPPVISHQISPARSIGNVSLFGIRRQRTSTLVAAQHAPMTAAHVTSVTSGVPSLATCVAAASVDHMNLPSPVDDPPGVAVSSRAAGNCSLPAVQAKNAIRPLLSDPYGAGTAAPGVALESAVFAFVTPVLVRANEFFRL